MSVNYSEKGVILIVDDTPVNLEMLLDLLESAGLKVIVAEDGESAVEMAAYAQPDLILLDIIMPGVDGFETCRRLKNNQATLDIPIIFMTALNEKVDKVKGLTLGAVDYVIKPLDCEEVLARVNIHLRLQNLTKRLIEQNERLEQESQERQRAQEELSRAFKALQQSEARFRRLVESNIMGIICTDLSGNIIEANEAFLGMVGYDRSQLRTGGLRWDKMTPSEYWDLERGAIASAIAKGVFTPYEKEYIRSDGSRVPVMVGGALVEESQEIFGFVLDLSDRKQAERKIREQAALLDIATDAIFVRDLHNKISFWNKGAERIYGWKGSETIGQNSNELLYRSETLSQLQNCWKSLMEFGSWEGELHQVTKQGNEIVVASRWTLVRDEQGSPKSILTVNTDITDKKQLETRFYRAQRLESIGTLAGGIAHDLNNILTPILAAAQLLQLMLPDADARSQQMFNILETNAKRGAALVNQVLQFARGVESQSEIVRVEHLIWEIKQMARETFPKCIKFSTYLKPDLWAVCGDATHLHQVLMNLAVNARDAMPNGGTLSILAENVLIDERDARMNFDVSAGPYIKITVSDTGIGMPPEILDRIFEPFFTTKEIGKGTGLGLSTVRGILKSHGGFVNISSQVGKGTEFQVFLPAVQTREAPLAANLELPKGNGEWVLVVDDEAEILETTKISLEAYNYKVLTASNGMDAIALHAQHKDKICVALVDMTMPSMDGAATIRLLQKNNSLVKIIALSGLLASEKLEPSIQTFIHKPFTTQTLLQTLREVMV